MNEDFITASLPSQEQIEAEKSPELQSIEAEQQQDDYNLAALSDHPGWQQIRDKMEKDAKHIRSLKDLNMKTYTDKELGEVVRGEFRVAEKLEEYIKSVDDAVKAVVTNNAQRKQ